jgi:hypothetical protein
MRGGKYFHLGLVFIYYNVSSIVQLSSTCRIPPANSGMSNSAEECLLNNGMI